MLAEDDLMRASLLSLLCAASSVFAHGNVALVDGSAPLRPVQLSAIETMLNALQSGQQYE